MKRLLASLVVAFLGALTFSTVSVAHVGSASTDPSGRDLLLTASSSSGLSVHWSPVLADAGWILGSVTVWAAKGQGFAPAEQVLVTFKGSGGDVLCQLAASSPIAAASLVVDRRAIDRQCGVPVPVGSIAAVSIADASTQLPLTTRLR